MASIDRVDWHSSGDYPDGLPSENGGTHIGMYLNWIIDNNLIGSIHIENSKTGIKNVKSRKITGREFLFEYCDGKFWNEDLNEEGLAFTKIYYQDPKDPEGGFGDFLDDYCDLLGDEYESLYEIPNTWENYEKLARKISTEYNKWKKKGNQESWKFWKRK